MQLVGGVTNCSTQTSIILECDAPDPLFHLIGIFLVELFDDVELYVSAALTCKAIDGVDIAHCLQSLAHKDKPFLLDLDDATAGMRVGLERIAGDGAGRRGRLVKQDRYGNITLFTQAFGVDVLGL